MSKISAMYKWSGGTDYRHTCYECRNCKKVKRGSRTLYKCLAYGDTESAASDWKASYIACRHFNKPVPEIEIIKLQSKKKRNEKNGQIEGQLSIFDIESR